MKKKGLNLLVATFVLICCIICSFALVACSKDEANGYVGTYYEYEKGQKTDFWIKLDKDAWSSSDEAGGRLEINGEEVTAYADFFGEEDVFFTGTVKDGVLTYSMIKGMEYKAYKDGAYKDGSTGDENNPNNPDTPNKETFTVTFNTVGGSSVSNATVSSGDTVAAPADPTKSGYNFVGWYSDSSYTNKWQFTTPVRSNIILYAKWEAQIAKYTVSFDSNGGSAVASAQVNDGDKLTAPTQPVRKMYVFDGWYKDSGFTQVWDFDTDTVTKNITLYAKWKEEEVRITSVNNATIEDNEITMVVSEGTDDVDMNGKVVLNNPNATWKLYYDKLGQMEIPTKLATNKNETLGEGSNIFYIVVTNANGTQTKNYVLDIYKKYEVNVAVYGLNGTTPIETLSAVTLETMPTPTATVTGYTIIGWDSTSVAPGETLPKDSPRLIKLTARLKANTYKVTLDGNGGTLDETEYNAIFDSAITLPVPTKEGYTFIGWYKGDEKVTNGKGQTTWTIAKDTALTAKYRANVYSVTADKNISEAGTVSASGDADSAVLTFDNNGRAGATEIDSQTVTYYYGMSVPTPPKADGYLFTGWYNEPACKTRFDFTKNIYCDTTAYAGWYYTGTSSTVRYMYEYSAEIQVTTSDDYQYIYFAPVTSGTYYLYYKNSTSSSTNAARMTVYNRTKNVRIQSETSVTNTSYTNVSFTANAGDIYYVRVGKYSSSSTFSCYLKPSATTSNKGYFRTPDNVASAGFQSRVSLRATTNNGYTFIGWFKGEEKVSSDLSMTITAPSENVVYTAKWYKLDLQLSDTKAGSVGGLTKAYKVGDSATITATTNAGYTWVGWFDGETKLTDELSYTFNMPSENKTYTAKWILCPVTLEKNIEEAGNVSGVEGATKVGEEVTITATTNAGYTWVGWYDGETKLTDELSYTFNMPSENKTYAAKWCQISLQCNDTKAGSVGGLTKAYKVGDSATITATTNVGYTWVGWYDGETKLTDKLSYTFEMTSESKNYTAKWILCLVTLEKNIKKAGTVSGLETATLGKETTITATTNAGYTFIGWYDGETLVSEDLEYTFIMSTESKTYTAKWILCPVTLEKNIEEAGTVSGVETNILGKETTITATTNVGYIFIGWYDGDTKVSEELTYTFTMSAETKTYTAKFEKCTEHTPDDNCVCTKCGTFVEDAVAKALKSKAYIRNDKTIYFGSYPQTKVTDSNITTALNNMAGTLPTSSNSANWTSYGYYISGSVSNFMWYIDLEYNGEKYRGVYFTSYRPYDTTTSSSAYLAYQYNNDGYYTSTVYWFRYDPIKWTILDESDGKALILADLALDSQQYYRDAYEGTKTRNGRSVYANDYVESDIRKWLNDTFYNTAFTDLQKSLIETTAIDNKTTGYNTNTYNSNQINTEDKIFLLSYKDVFNTSAYFNSSAARQKKSTDYAKSQGCWTNTDSSYAGACCWWLRSPRSSYSDRAYSVVGGGGYFNYFVFSTDYGVVPALWINLN